MNRYERKRQHISLVDFDRVGTPNPEFVFDTLPGDVVLAAYMVRNYNPANSVIRGMRTLVYRDSSTSEYTGLWGAVSKGGRFRVAYTQAANAWFGAMVLRPAVPVRGIMSASYSNVIATARANHIYARRGVNALISCGALSAADASGGATGAAMNLLVDRADYGDETGAMSFVPDPERYVGSASDMDLAGMGTSAYEQRYFVSVR